MSKTPLPRWRCIKVVEAFKIGDIVGLQAEELTADDEPKADGAMIYPEDTRLSPVTVTREYMDKHKPQVGGYFVRYNDGYESWSPAKAFEEGYRPI